MTSPLAELISQVSYFLFILIVIGLIFLALLGLVYGLILFLRHSRREEQSLSYVLLQVALPADNEINDDEGS